MDCRSFLDASVDVLLGEAGEPDVAAWRAHQDACSRCAAEAAQLSRLIGKVRDLDAPPTSSGFRSRVLARLRTERECAVDTSAGGLVLRLRRRVASAAALRIVAVAAALLILGVAGLLFVTSRRGASPAPEQDRVAVNHDAPALPAEPEPSKIPDAGEDAVPMPRKIDRDLADANVEAPGRLEPPEIPDIQDAPPSLPHEAVAEVEEAGRRDRDEALRHLLWKRSAVPGRSPAEQAARDGLKWLASLQEEDGSFDPEAHGGQPEARVGVTALAMVAFLWNAERGVPGGLHRAHVRRGFQFLRESVDATGTFGNVRGAPDVTLFNHAVATLAFAEKCVLTGPEDAALVANALVRLDDLSGLRSMRERRDADNTTAPWIAYALETAQQARIPVPFDLRSSAQHARTFVALIVDPEQLDLAGLPPDAQLTAAAATSALSTTGPVYRPPLDVLLGCLLTPERREPSRMFFATVDFEQRGGMDWSRWREHLTRVLLEAQDEDGAWGADYEWDPISRAGGDIYETTLHILSLSEPFRANR